MNRNGKLHALLSTARVANIPSVVSNVWVGVALGTIAKTYSGQPTFQIPWILAASLAISGVSMYVGGNFFNDWMDRGWDAKHRPERALPRSLFSAGNYLALAILLLVAGIGLAWVANPRSGIAAGAIVFWIVIYTIWHKRTSWAVVPMGLCRALLPAMGFLALHPYVDMIWPAAGALFFYIMGLSLSARYEAMSEPPRRVGVMARGFLLFAVVLVAIGNRALVLDRLPSIWGALPYLAWTGFCLRFWRKPVPKLVSGLLAGIPFVDWMALLPVAMTFMGDSRDGAWPMALTSFIIAPLAFVAALLLQRLAPAT